MPRSDGVSFQTVVELVGEQLKKFPQNPKAAQAVFECYLETKDDKEAEQLLTVSQHLWASEGDVWLVLSDL